jgi:hypothetical protein
MDSGQADVCLNGGTSLFWLLENQLLASGS